MKIGFVGYGEAAFNISLGLKGEGVEGIRANDAMMNHEVMGKQVHARYRATDTVCVIIKFEADEVVVRVSGQMSCFLLSRLLLQWMFVMRLKTACVRIRYM